MSSSSILVVSREREFVCCFYPFKPHSFEGESLLMSIALTLDDRDDFRFALLPSCEKNLTTFSEARRAKFPPWPKMGKLIKM